MLRAVGNHFISKIFVTVQNSFAFLAGQRPIVLATKSNESLADA